MRHSKLLVTIAACLAPCFGTGAQHVGGSDTAKAGDTAILRHVLAAGGGESTSGSYTIRGTIGQLDAEPLHPASGGMFALSGGFWREVALASAPGETMFADGFE